MIIVTMMTENYEKGFVHFYNSFRLNNNHKIICYCINFQTKLKYKDVEFRYHEGKFDKETTVSPEGVVKVTHLKSVFLKNVAIEFSQNVLWIDSSKLIMKSIDWIDLEKYDWVAIRRNTNKLQKMYFAGLFGFNRKSPELKKYYEECQRDKDDWFCDQKAFTKLDKKNALELNYQEYVSGETNMYDDNFLIVRNLGKSGEDKFAASDKYFSAILKKYQPETKKASIMAFMHKPYEDWCFLTSIKNVQKYSKHDIYICDSVKDGNYLKKQNPDLVWSRGGIFLMGNFLRLRRDLRPKVIHTVTHGGELLTDRLRKIAPLSSGTKAIFVQNSDSKVRLDHLVKDVPVYLIPNGVDLEAYQPQEKPKEFTVGFVGRTAQPSEANQKGYELFMMACKILGVKYKLATNESGKRLTKEQMPKFYNSINCLVLPSHSEGHSNALNEAQASGLPCVATKVGYHGEVGKDYEDIIFCTRSVYDIMEKIKYLRDNPKERERIGKNARAFAEKHDAQLIAKQFDYVFDQLLQN